MRRVHVLGVALVLAAAAVFGVLAATRTVGLRSAQANSPHPANVAITARAHRLDRVEASLKRALRDKPPALPAVPAAAARPPSATAPPHVVYRRPAPIVIVRHTSHHDDSGDHESSESGGDD